MPVNHEQMAKDPCRFGPFLLVAAHAEQVHEPIEVRLQVGFLHPREPEQVAPQPRAQVVDERHGLQVGRIARIGLVGLVGAFRRPDQRVVGLLLVVHDYRAARDVGQQRVLDSLGGRLAVPADDGDGVLAGVDCHRDADLVLGKAPLLGEVGAAHDVGVGQIQLVYPHPAAQHEPVLAAVHGGEDPVAPLEGRLVRHLAHLGNQVDRRVVAHACDEPLPGREALLAAFEHRAAQGGERLSAYGAAPALPPGGRLAVAGAARKAA